MSLRVASNLYHLVISLNDLLSAPPDKKPLGSTKKYRSDTMVSSVREELLKAANVNWDKGDRYVYRYSLLVFSSTPKIVRNTYTLRLYCVNLQKGSEKEKAISWRTRTPPMRVE